jgi:hypothetical protein
MTRQFNISEPFCSSTINVHFRVDKNANFVGHAQSAKHELKSTLGFQDNKY